jgi:hypothetical protein
VSGVVISIHFVNFSTAVVTVVVLALIAERGCLVVAVLDASNLNNLTEIGDLR